MRVDLVCTSFVTNRIDTVSHKTRQ